jgi:hypothetical protein
MNAELIGALVKAGLTPAEAKATAAPFKAWGYSLTKEYTGTGDHLLQTDDQRWFLVNRLLRVQTPMKRMDQHAAYEVFRTLALDGWRIVLPTKALPNVP